MTYVPGYDMALDVALGIWNMSADRSSELRLKAVRVFIMDHRSQTVIGDDYGTEN
jgi:hypothetical protein